MSGTEVRTMAYLVRPSSSVALTLTFVHCTPTRHRQDQRANLQQLILAQLPRTPSTTRTRQLIRTQLIFAVNLCARPFSPRQFFNTHTVC